MISRSFCPCYGLPRWLAVALLAAWLPAQAGIVVQTQSFRLRTGDVVEGRYDVEAHGLFHHTLVGGKLYRWHEIDAASLPAALREQVRERLLQRAVHAQALYAADDIDRAEPLFKAVADARHFLTPDDLARPELLALGYKARGWVQEDGEWMSFRERQRNRGLRLYDGEWLPAEIVRETIAFKGALQAAAGADDPERAALRLRALIARYPDSPYVTTAERTVAALLSPPTRPAPPVIAAPEPEPEPRPAAPRDSVRFVVEHRHPGVEFGPQLIFGERAPAGGRQPIRVHRRTTTRHSQSGCRAYPTARLRF
jgi:hypothetical protein